MNTFDIIIAGILIFGFVRGLLKGLFVSIASLIAIFLGIYGAFHFSFFVGEWLQNSVKWDENIVKFVSICITFAIILLGVNLLGKLLTKMADSASLGTLNKILGGVFGALKFGLILSGIFIFFGKANKKFPMVKQTVLDESLMYEPVRKVALIIFPSDEDSDENSSDETVEPSS